MNKEQKEQKSELINEITGDFELVVRAIAYWQLNDPILRIPFWVFQHSIEYILEHVTCTFDFLNKEQLVSELKEACSKPRYKEIYQDWTKKDKEEK